jgi:hypothetical protein
MARVESRIRDEGFEQALSRARLNLAPPEVRERVWLTVIAAMAFAVCALSFATAAILAPPVQLDPIPAVRGPAV